MLKAESSVASRIIQDLKIKPPDLWHAVLPEHLDFPAFQLKNFPDTWRGAENFARSSVTKHNFIQE